jgi:hypothetical protein
MGAVALAQEEYAESLCRHRRDNFRNIRVGRSGGSSCRRAGVEEVAGR